MHIRRVFLAGLVVLMSWPSVARDYRYKAIACSSASGLTIRMETEVERDANGTPTTDDKGYVRAYLGSAWTEGVFDREGEYYYFKFPALTVAVDRNGGAAVAYRSQSDQNKQVMLCVPAML